MLKAPLYAALVVTGRCNLRCQHCLANAVLGSDAEELSEKELIGLIDQLADANVTTLNINGGEPFVLDYLSNIIQYAYHRGLRVILSTNGTLITRAWMERHHHMVAAMRVSLDSSAPQKHDEFRGVQGAFRRAIAGIELAVEHGIPVTVITTLHRNNVSEIPEMIALLRCLDVKGWSTTLLMPVGRAESLTGDVLSPEEVHDLVVSLNNWRAVLAAEENSLRISQELPEAALLCAAESQPTLPHTARCSAGYGITILPNGYALPCSSFIDFPELFTEDLDVRRHTLMDIFHNSPFFRVVRERSNLSGKCARCEFIAICGGGCRVAAYKFFGNLEAPDPFCWYEPRG